MSASVPIPAHLSALPDDVLRALTNFVPLSGLLVLTRCSRGMQSVLRTQLSRRMDDLFALSTQSTRYAVPFPIRVPISWDDLEREIKAIFGEANRYTFIEAPGPKGFDVPLWHRRGDSVYNMDHGGSRDGRISCQIVTPTFSPQRFVDWLRRRYNQLLTTEASP
jgi:hypothetical protein